VKWLLKPLDKMLSSCFTQPVTVCNALANSTSFLIHPPVEPNKQEKQKNKFFLSLYLVPLVLEGQYVLIAKDNQPTLTEDIADLFEDRTPDRRRWLQAETWDKGHGRLEHRQITCSPDLNDWFGKQWEGIEQVFRLERTVRLLKTNQIRHEVVYGLSSLSMRQAPPERLLSLIREHWAIENRLHHRRDVSLGEDACQTRTGPVPSLLAQLNSTVLSLMDRAGVRNVARQMRFFDAHYHQALALVLTGSCLVY